MKKILALVLVLIMLMSPAVSAEDVEYVDLGGEVFYIQDADDGKFLSVGYAGENLTYLQVAAEVLEGLPEIEEGDMVKAYVRTDMLHTMEYPPVYPVEKLEVTKAAELEGESLEEPKETNESFYVEELRQLREAPTLDLDEIKRVQDELKKIRRERYTDEELAKIENEAELIKEQNEGVDLLAVENIHVIGKIVKFDTPPVIVDGRTLVPIRAITEAFGAEIEWNGEKQQVTIYKDGTEIVLTLGSKEVTVNGSPETIDTEAKLFSNRTYVPLRFISESFGADINWDNDNRVVEIGQ